LGALRAWGRKEVTPMLAKILISLAALAAALVTLAPATQLSLVNGPQPVYSASNDGGGGGP